MQYPRDIVKLAGLENDVKSMCSVEQTSPMLYRPVVVLAYDPRITPLPPNKMVTYCDFSHCSLERKSMEGVGGKQA